LTKSSSTPTCGDPCRRIEPAGYGSPTLGYGMICHPIRPWAMELKSLNAIRDGFTPTCRPSSAVRSIRVAHDQQRSLPLELIERVEDWRSMIPRSAVPNWSWSNVFGSQDLPCFGCDSFSPFPADFCWIYDGLRISFSSWRTVCYPRARDLERIASAQANSSRFLRFLHDEADLVPSHPS
jgi:hypothetical protein